jgi:hypothetical protein
MKIFDFLSCLDQIRGSPLGPMLREIVIRMLGHFEYNHEDGHDRSSLYLNSWLRIVRPVCQPIQWGGACQC